MAEILNDLKLSALKLSSTSNASPQPTYSDGSVTFTGTYTVSASHSGRPHFCSTNGATSTVTLPNITNLSLGDRFNFIQNATPETQVLVITTSGSDTFSEGSYLVNSNAAGETTGGELVLPGNITCTAFMVRNTVTNAAHGIGSTLDCQVVAKNRWLLVGRAEPLGAGATAGGSSGSSTGAYQWSASTSV